MFDKEITLEIAKNKADEIVVQRELETAKRDFINELNGGLGEEIKHNCNDINIPQKIRKPFIFKLKAFLKRINNVLSN